MKNTILALFLICTIGFTSIVSASGESTATKVTQPTNPTSMFRISFWPDVICWPANHNIRGLSLGVPGSYGESQTKVNGADLALLISESPNVDGLQMSLITVGSDSYGLQLGLANAADKIDGVQVGLFNAAVSRSDSFQVGIINKNINSDGFQIGLLNFMDDGLLPLLPLFNYSLQNESK